MEASAFNFDDKGQVKKPTPEELAKADETNDIIVLSKGTQADGQPYYAYMAVPPSKFAEFYQISKDRKTFNLTDYGFILFSGNEAEPPQGAKDYMRQVYNYDEEFAQKLEKSMLEESKKHQGKMEEKRVMDIVAMLKNAKPAGNG